MKGSLKKSLNPIKDLEQEVYSLKDEAMAFFDEYFKWEKEHITFFYPGLDLILMDLFKVV